MEEKELKAENIPWGYARCFNDACKRKDTCMHYLAKVLTNQQDRFTGCLCILQPGRRTNALATARKNW